MPWPCGWSRNWRAGTASRSPSSCRPRPAVTAGGSPSCPGSRIIERAELDHQAFLDAGLPSARALALLRQDDLGNFHAALRAQELNPDLRLVLAIFNTGLGERIRAFFTDCAVLSEASMAAPSFVAAALGEPAPSHVRLAGRTLYVARRDEVDHGQLVCGLAASADAAAPSLLPPADTSDGLVLAVADGTPRDPLTRQHPGPLRTGARLLRGVLRTKMGAAFVVLAAVLVAGYLLLAVAVGYSPVNSLYLTLLDAAGAAVSNPRLSSPEKVAQFLLTFAGLAVLPLVTAAVVGARLTGSAAGTRPPLTDHVIVVGLGNVGTRIVGQLHDLGIGVACVDKNPDAAGVPLARQPRAEDRIRRVAPRGDAAGSRDRQLPGRGLSDQRRHRQPGDRAARPGARRGAAPGRPAPRR